MRKILVSVLLGFYLLPVLFPEGLQTVTEKEAGLVLEQWLAAQNSGNFDNYSELYGVAFKGIKRSGTVSAEYNRDNWLKDRKGMFKAKMQVEARSAEITIKGKRTEIRFIQIWASGNFKDAGTKILELEKTENKVKILSEEMIDSYIIDSKVQQGVKADIPFILLADKFLILTRDTEKGWRQGVMEALPGLDYPAVAAADADPAAIPQSFRKYNNLVVNLYSSTGRRILGKITALKMVAAVMPHFSTFEEWQRNLIENEEFTAVELGSAIWNEAGEEGHYLAAEVEYTPGEIAPGSIVMATVFGEKELEIMKQVDVSDAGYNQVESSLNKQHLLDPEVLSEGGWDPDAHPLDFLKEFTNSKGTHFLSLQIVLTTICSGDIEEVGNFWELGRNSLIPRVTVSGTNQLLLCFDVNGNGIPDLLFYDSFTGYTLFIDYKKAVEVDIPYHDCPC